MNFQSLSILDFKMKISPLKSNDVVFYFLMGISILLVGSMVVSNFHILYTENELIFSYQYDRIKSSKNIELLIVGDSSAGNAINENSMEQISGKKTLNVSLTGVYGIMGSLQMIKQAKKYNPHLKKILIIQSTDIWRRAFSPESYFATSRKLQSLSLLSAYFKKEMFSDFLMYKFGFHNYIRLMKYKFQLSPIYSSKIDLHTGYLLQRDNKYSENKMKIVPDYERIIHFIHPDKIKALEELNTYCKQEILDCLYAHGPLLSGSLSADDHTYLQLLDNLIISKSHIQFIETNYIYEKTFIGDHVDHITPEYQNESTLDYYKKVRDSLK